MVFGAKLRTIMSSIIRWRKGETLRAVAMDCSKGMLLLMGSKVAEKIAAGKRPWPELRQCRERCEKKFSSAAFPRSGLVQCGLMGPIADTASKLHPRSKSRHLRNPGCVAELLQVEG